MPKNTASSAKSKAQKPEKPYEGFPLFPHATGRWAKKIRGKLHYFGKWDDPQAAMDRFHQEWPYLSKGETPPPVDTGEGCSLQLLCNSFLTAKRNLVDAGELTLLSFEEYYATCSMLVARLGKDRRADDLRSSDFASLRKSMAEQWGPVRLRNTITRVRMVFKFAYDERLIEHPIHYGQSFSLPAAKILRETRNEAGPRLFEADEIRKILDAANPFIKAMVLLGINCGFGNTDVANLPQSSIDIENGWVDYPRPKTAVKRRVPLWPETMEALKAAIASRTKPKDPKDSGLCFLTTRGTRFVRVQESKTTKGRHVTIDALSRRFESLISNLEIKSRKGLGFYALRHTFETIGGESRDQVAVNAIMGHVDNSMAATYRERISDERLKAVVDVVHQWLWGKG